ncbi:MAG: hypothetical protein JSS86_11630 [Cyanobacteria bacterium SZAS LIN-2]|nr:hypothetical protein [Cyanobacteria bacterium SZAS LIN-3]MBS1996958.1 hypothetical protein [Cyanobacteria bacterium SZAS LIN-2]MBS2008735.1 hypothetical protein [Cyanobacteria bacterium SZAS TMP-1]
MGDGRNQEVAKELMHKAADQKDITVDYNKLTPEDQKGVFSAMQDLKKSTKEFGDLELVGTDDGRLKDMTVKKGVLDFTRWVGSSTKDVYDTPEDIQKKLEEGQAKLRKLIGG